MLTLLLHRDKQFSVKSFIFYFFIFQSFGFFFEKIDCIDIKKKQVIFNLFNNIIK